jgi:disulfide bond formation protein DsbB
MSDEASFVFPHSDAAGGRGASNQRIKETRRAKRAGGGRKRGLTTKEGGRRGAGRGAAERHASFVNGLFNLHRLLGESWSTAQVLFILFILCILCILCAWSAGHVPIAVCGGRGVWGTVTIL